MSAWCRRVHVRLHCCLLTEACSCRLELAYFAGKISKNRLVCKNAVALAYYGSCRLLVMGSWFQRFHKQINQSENQNLCSIWNWIIINYTVRDTSTYFYIARLSLNKMSTVLGWFLVTCLWSNSNVSRPGYNCAVVTRTPSLFVFALWKSKYITKHFMYGPSGN